MTEHWGRWRECAAARPGEYAGARAARAHSPASATRPWSSIDTRFLVFALNAYQTFLFNQVLARLDARDAAEHTVS